MSECQQKFNLHFLSYCNLQTACTGISVMRCWSGILTHFSPCCCWCYSFNQTSTTSAFVVMNICFPSAGAFCPLPGGCGDESEERFYQRGKKSESAIPEFDQRWWSSVTHVKSRRGKMQDRVKRGKVFPCHSVKLHVSEWLDERVIPCRQRMKEEEEASCCKSRWQSTRRRSERTQRSIRGRSVNDAKKRRKK